MSTGEQYMLTEVDNTWMLTEGGHSRTGGRRLLRILLLVRLTEAPDECENIESEGWQHESLEERTATTVKGYFHKFAESSN